VNVEAQEATATSLLRWVRAIVTLRSRYRAFGRGSFEPLAPQNRRVLAFLRRYGDEIILCVNNLARHAQYVELDLREFNGWSPMELWSGQAFPKIGELPYLLTMSGRDFLWFKLQPPGGPERLGAVSQVGA
jgi:maltose alpha-D-glucosyltransferase/alpha-amylase